MQKIKTRSAKKVMSRRAIFRARNMFTRTRNNTVVVVVVVVIASQMAS